MNLQGRVALVTGAAQGIGGAIVREFVREGATVTAIDRQVEVERVCRDVGGRNGTTIPFVFDITDHEACRKCVEDVIQRRQKIDILVNNAAICFYGDIFEDSLDQWRQTQAVNLEAIYWASKLVVPYMARQDWGRLISISSTQALATEGRVGGLRRGEGALS